MALAVAHAVNGIGDPMGGRGDHGATKVWPMMPKISAIGTATTIAANVLNRISPPV